MSMQTFTDDSNLETIGQSINETNGSIDCISSPIHTPLQTNITDISRVSLSKNLRGSSLNRQQKQASQRKKFPIRIEAHRGAGHLEPENSLKAFKRAVELGIDGVETDVWLTKDQIPVIVHGGLGGLVQFAGNISEKIGQINSSDLHKYILKNGENIPTLRQVLEICRDKVHLNIEIKEFKEVIVNRILEVLEQMQMLNQVTLSSFLHSMRKKLTNLLNVRGSKTKVSFGYLVKYPESRFPNYNDTQPGDSLNLDVNLLLKGKREKLLEELKKAQEKNMKLNFWFPIEYSVESDYYQELINLKADTIITNKPMEMMQYFTKQNIV